MFYSLETHLFSGEQICCFNSSILHNPISSLKLGQGLHNVSGSSLSIKYSVDNYLGIYFFGPMVLNIW